MTQQGAPRVLTEAEARALVERTLRFSKADAARVNVSSSRETNLRFADNQMSTSGASTNTTIRVQSVFGKRKASVVTNDRTGNPDLVLVEKVLDQIEAQECIDTSRIYATGLSNGAFLSSTIGCVLNDRFAAIAPVSGLVFGSGCKPGRHVPVLTFHGTADPILLFNGGIGDVLGSILGGKKPTAQKLPAAKLDGPGYPANVRRWAK